MFVYGLCCCGAKDPNVDNSCIATILKKKNRNVAGSLLSHLHYLMPLKQFPLVYT